MSSLAILLLCSVVCEVLAFKFTTDNNAAEVVDQDKCQGRTRSSCRLTSDSALLLNVLQDCHRQFCCGWTFSCHSCLHINNNNETKRTTFISEAGQHI